MRKIRSNDSTGWDLCLQGEKSKVSPIACYMHCSLEMNRWAFTNDIAPLMIAETRLSEEGNLIGYISKCFLNFVERALDTVYFCRILRETWKMLRNNIEPNQFFCIARKRCMLHVAIFVRSCDAKDCIERASKHWTVTLKLDYWQQRHVNSLFQSKIAGAIFIDHKLVVK